MTSFLKWKVLWVRISTIRLMCEGVYTSVDLPIGKVVTLWVFSSPFYIKDSTWTESTWSTDPPNYIVYKRFCKGYIYPCYSILFGIPLFLFWNFWKNFIEIFKTLLIISQTGSTEQKVWTVVLSIHVSSGYQGLLV